MVSLLNPRNDPPFYVWEARTYEGQRRPTLITSPNTIVTDALIDSLRTHSDDIGQVSRLLVFDLQLGNGSDNDIHRQQYTGYQHIGIDATRLDNKTLLTVWSSIVANTIIYHATELARVNRQGHVRGIDVIVFYESRAVTANNANTKLPTYAVYWRSWTSQY